MSSAEKKKYKPQLIFKDKQIFLVNKPAGWVTLNVDTYSGETLEDWVVKNIQFSNSAFQKKRAGIVHRLDKDTWGIVLGARNKRDFNFLQQQFKKRQVRKKYLALVSGELRSEGKVVSPIGRMSYNRFKYGVTPDGKQAETRFKPKDKYIIEGRVYTLVEVWPKTGRTHQIRVHMQYLSHPVYGDSLYGGKLAEKRTMFLVAQEISFLHPKSKEEISFRIDLPQELEIILKNAKKKES